MNEEKKKDNTSDPTEYHLVHEDDHKQEELQQHQEEPSLAIYALIKYISLIIIVIAVLYFIAVFVLPLIRDFLR